MNALLIILQIFPLSCRVPDHAEFVDGAGENRPFHRSYTRHDQSDARNANSLSSGLKRASLPS